MHSQYQPGYSSQSLNADGYYTEGRAAPSDGYHSQPSPYQSSFTQTHFSFFASPPARSVTYSRQRGEMSPEEICYRIL